MNVVRCPHCERYNNVPRGSRGDVPDVKCVRCGRIIVIPHTAVDDSRPEVGPLGYILFVIGLLCWPAGLMIGIAVAAAHPRGGRLDVAAGFAGTFLGLIVHFGLFLTVPQVHNATLLAWQQIAIRLPHHGG